MPGFKKTPRNRRPKPPKAGISRKEHGFRPSDGEPLGKVVRDDGIEGGAADWLGDAPCRPCCCCSVIWANCRVVDGCGRVLYDPEKRHPHVHVDDGNRKPAPESGETPKEKNMKPCCRIFGILALAAVMLGLALWATWDSGVDAGKRTCKEVARTAEPSRWAGEIPALAKPEPAKSAEVPAAQATVIGKIKDMAKTSNLADCHSTSGRTGWTVEGTVGDLPFEMTVTPIMIPKPGVSAKADSRPARELTESERIRRYLSQPDDALDAKMRMARESELIRRWLRSEGGCRQAF